MADLEKVKVGFIGFGNMGQALADGLLYTGTLKPGQILACAGHYGRLKANAEKRGILACQNAEEVVKGSDVIVVAVKPWMVETVIKPVHAFIQDKVVVSVAAGYLYEEYERILPEGCHHISTVPNTPVSVGSGITICEERHSLSEDEYQLVRALLSGVGLVLDIEGDHVSIASAVGGCGPAFASMFTEALADAGVLYGLPLMMAYQLAAQMIAGTGKLMLESGKHPGEMKDEVCSPGGTTIAGVAALESNGLRCAVIEAVKAVMGRYES